ncbi:MAG: hypothetical protein EGQ78_09110 [Clostridiales bacterium]|nr:hypothetical protein [Clostridiales bacterium]
MFISKVFDVVKFIFAYLFSFGLKFIKKDIWLITERRFECKDNGYYLYKYIRENHPDRNTYYVIDKKSKQIEKIKDYDNIIYFNSFKHYVYALASSKLIGAFIPVGIPDSVCFYKFDKLIKGKKVFLQHGIIKEKLNSLTSNNLVVDLFICGAKPEYEYINSEYGYQNGVVQYTGLCRYDGLNNYKTEKFILVMPTWRQWIPSATFGNGKISNLDEYDYFVKYKGLLSNEELNDLLLSSGYKLLFFLHHEMQPYIDYFQICGNEHITICSENDYDVQYLLKSAALLITDYSSVAFDFAYMKKPIIYYQFDESLYYKKHYERGYFDYDKMGFGKKVNDVSDLLFEIKKIINNGFDVDEKYLKHIDEFFVYRDNKNCERVYKCIEKI